MRRAQPQGGAGTELLPRPGDGGRCDEDVAPASLRVGKRGKPLEREEQESEEVEREARALAGCTQRTLKGCDDRGRSFVRSRRDAHGSVPPHTCGDPPRAL